MYNSSMNENKTYRSCSFVVEMQAASGYRFWSAPMPESAVNGYIDGLVSLDYMLSDVDHSASMGCLGTCSESL